MNNRNLFLTVLEAASLRPECQDGGILVRTLFWVADCCPLNVSLLTEGGKRAFSGLLYKGANSIPKAPPSSYRHLGGQDFNIQILGGHKHSAYDTFL